MSTLTERIDDEHTGIEAIGAYLDGLDPDERAREVGALGRARQRLLYEKAAHAAPLGLGDFVVDAGARAEVIHDGVNTLPLPPPLRRFHKRFCRPDPTAPPFGGAAGRAHVPPVGHDDARLFGYNEGPTRRLIGPGYFVAIPTAGRPHWTARGPIVIDYFQV